MRTLWRCLIHTASSDVLTSIAQLMLRVIDALALSSSNLSADKPGRFGYTQLVRASDIESHRRVGADVVTY